MNTHDKITNIMAWLTQECGLNFDIACELTHDLRPISFSKRQCLVSEGEKCGSAFFLENGMTRSYWLVKGEEITTSFSTEGHLVFSMDEVYYNMPSEEYVEAIEPVDAYAISILRLRSLIENNHEIALWWAYIHQQEYRRLHRSHKERLTLDAAERYREFARQFPEVCRRARLGDIASYLGVTSSTLSRIRANRAFLS